jgi:hypothetical protein
LMTRQLFGAAKKVWIICMVLCLLLSGMASMIYNMHGSRRNICDRALSCLYPEPGVLFFYKWWQMKGITVSCLLLRACWIFMNSLQSIWGMSRGLASSLPCLMPLIKSISNVFFVQ